MLMSVCVEIGREGEEYVGERIHVYWIFELKYRGKCVVFGGKGVRKRSYVAPALRIKCI